MLERQQDNKRGRYDFTAIEAKWQRYWEERATFRTLNPGEPGADASKPKFYILDMFPYPSGAGLHVGHPIGYCATDIVARYKRMRGFNVLHPMGFDAFGLPAEQYAIETNVHPAVTTRKNIEMYRRQLKMFGFSYDWDRELATCEPGYYRWTQWMFARMYESWYDDEHLPLLSQVPGVLRARRFFDPNGKPRYVALYDLADENVPQHPDWQAALRTDWSRKIGKLTRNCEWILRRYAAALPSGRCSPPRSASAVRRPLPLRRICWPG